jgi:hypothetical protein
MFVFGVCPKTKNYAPIIFVQVANHPILRKIARVTGVSLTVFWGPYGLPVPFPRKIIGVLGKPLGLPVIAEPTQEDIDKWHGIYVQEIQRIFETYKVHNPDYKNKTLSFEE